TVVMPAQSSATKIARVAAYGAQVDRIDTTKVSRTERLLELCASDPDADAVSPYDDARVIAGNASLGAEIFGRTPFDRLVVPVGGGGLASGLIVARDALAARVPIVGAEPALANDAARSLRSGTLCQNTGEPPTLCDGARTASLGDRNFAILRRGMEDIVEVDEAQVRRALRLLFAEANLKAEPTGALALAGLLQHIDRFAGQRIACIVSGGNI